MQKLYCRVICSIVMLSGHLLLADNDCCVSHQFVPRSITTDLAYVDMSNFYKRHHAERNRFIYSGNFIYQKSRKSDELGSAFLLKNGKNCVNVAQNSLGLNPPTDINSYWLGLVNVNPANPFASEFCVTPQRRLFAYYNYMYADLSNWVCGLWADVAFAVLSVTHKLNCCEAGNTASACPTITTVADALNNPLDAFGKFNCGNGCKEQHRAGVDDLQVRLGYERGWCDDRHVWGVYAIGTIPTGRKPDAAYIFEPIIGSRHGSVGVGVDVDYQLWNCGDQNVTLLFDANYRYAFKRNECRTFDLCKNGAFSRFLLVAQESNPAVALPGINFFTQNIDVTPRSTAQAWLALHYERCNYDVEVGYNLFWRQQEEIGCAAAFTNEIGIFDFNRNTSASTAVISQGPTQITADTTFVTLTANDLNLRSGAADKALSNKFYGLVSTNGSACGCCMDWNVGLGGSYEFVTSDYRCAALSYWAVFGQFALLF